ncbi:MAG: Bug family tripartite tricarboxylate transporter substrate binding protein [Acetobacteraceae bacterium]
MTRLMGILLALCAVALAPPARAQDWPSKSVRLIVPYPPGGPTDLVGRVFAGRLSEIWHQPVVVENRSGANGNIASQLIAKSPPDGSAFMLHSSSMVINALLYKAPGYDPFADFTPISQVFDYKLVVVVHPSVKVNTFQDLVAMARAKPGVLTYASAGGAGAPTHLAVEMFKQRAGVDIVHVPYQGGAPATNDLLGGHVNLMFNNPTQSLPFIKSGQLRGLAVTGPTRNPQVPDLPTVAELGYPGFDVGTWFAIWGPAGLPPEIVKTASDAIMRVAREPEVVAKLHASGLNPIGGTPAELAGIMKSDYDIWGKVIREANIHID